MHDERFEEHAEAFKGMKLDELYRDESIVSPDFIEGKISWRCYEKYIVSALMVATISTIFVHVT